VVFVYIYIRRLLVSILHTNQSLQSDRQILHGALSDTVRDWTAPGDICQCQIRKPKRAPQSWCIFYENLHKLYKVNAQWGGHNNLIAFLFQNTSADLD
jgi:hypothetical protein